MNRAESLASNRVIDSLINYETVKYFSAEEHERRRCDRRGVQSRSRLVEASAMGCVIVAAFGCRRRGDATATRERGDGEWV